jgi:predicted phosphodiesterase
MRIAFLSDIHGNLPALEAVLAELAREPVDLVVNLGDIVSGPLWPCETADRLMALEWPTIAGNHERQLLTLPRERMSATDAFTAERLGDGHRAWLQGLPPQRRIEPDVWCIHGTPGSDLVYLLETQTPGYGVNGAPGVRAATAREVRDRLGAPLAALVACGHSHVPRVVQVDATLVSHPGSVGLQAYDDDHLHRHLVETGSPQARYARAERIDGVWRAQLRCVPYDHDAAARQAERNGAADWAHALRTGYALPPAHWQSA